MNFWIFLLLFINYVECWCHKTTFAGSSEIKSLDFSPDGQYLLSGETSGKLLIWRTDTLDIVNTYMFGAIIWQAVYSKDQKYIAIAGAQNDVHILNATTMNLLVKVNTNHNNIVFDVDFRYDSKYFATCGDDHYTKIWAVGTWVNIAAVQNKHSCFSVEYADNGQWVVAGQHYYQIYGLTLTFFVQKFQLFHDSSIMDFLGLRIRPGSTYFIATNSDGNLYQATMRGNYTIISDSFPNGLYSCGYSRDATYFASAGMDGKVYMYNATNRVNTLEGIFLTNATTSLNASQFSYDSNYFVTADQIGAIYLYSRFCAGCPSGTYPNQTLCRQCAQFMPGCNFCIDSTFCKSCVSGYYLNDTTDLCVSCDLAISGCANCNSSLQCQSCLPSFYLDTGVCLSCILAMQGCYQCTGATACIQCESSFYLSTGQCVRCTALSHCLKCSNSTYCLQCIPNYYLSNGVCTLCNFPIPNCMICQNNITCTACIRGYMLNIVNSTTVCKKCTPECLFCNNTGHCFDCVQQMFVSPTYSCQFCKNPCSTCNSSTYCLSCILGYYMVTPGSCTVCPISCLSCNSSNYCQSCGTGSYLLVPNQTCVRCNIAYTNCRQCTPTECLTCQIGYTLNAGVCDSCNNLMASCQLCFNDTICTMCVTGYFLTNNTCIMCSAGCSNCNSTASCSACLPGYYISNFSCVLCANKCLTCTLSSAISCMNCKQGYFLSSTPTGSCLSCSTVANPKCIACLNSSHCIGCKIGYLLTSPTNCTICSSPCSTCKLLPSNCLTCNLGYYLNISAGVGSCLSCQYGCLQCQNSSSICLNCIEGFFYNDTLYQCFKCQNTLLGCFSCSSSTNCTQCVSGYYLSSGACQLCSSNIANCLKCSPEGMKCLVCDAAYTLGTSNSSCHLCKQSLFACESCNSTTECEVCMVGYYTNSGVCTACPTPCVSCLNQSYCDICIENYVLLVNMSCQLCQTAIMGCQFCSSNSSCTDCNVGYFLNGSSCTPCQTTLEGCQNCISSSVCLECGIFYQLQLNNTCKLCSSIYSGCQVCRNSTIGCVECQMGYFLDSVLGICNSCGIITSQGCLKCTSSTVCTECISGYYLSIITYKCIRCDNTFTECIYCTSSACLQCGSGYYLQAGQCKPCIQTGCQICLQANPVECVTCNNMYFMNNSKCYSCNQFIPSCSECNNASVCTQCAAGFYLAPTNQCAICSSKFESCSLCTIAACIDCIANYFLNTSDGQCHNCNDYMQGCSYCMSQFSCLSCQNGYYQINGTCMHCLTIPGCLNCLDDTSCTHCQQSYFLSINDSLCYLCNEHIPDCYACSNESVCLSCKGNYQLISNECIEIKGQVTKHTSSIKLKSYYINETTLKHILFARQFRFRQIQQNWTTQSGLMITDQNYVQYNLTILKVEFSPNLDQIIFYTNNPIANQLSQSVTNMPFVQTARRRMLTATNPISLNLNFDLKLKFTEKACQQLMPQLKQMGDLYLTYPYSDPQFYSSVIKNKKSYYYLAGYFILSLLLIGYFIKLAYLIPSSLDRGDIIPHIQAIKCGALALYPTYTEYINFCYGFMLADLPWFNSFFGNTLANVSDNVPSPYLMYFVNLSLVSTYLLAFSAIVIIWFVFALISYLSESIKPICSMLKSLCYNFFILGATMAGCLALQGAIMNPISSLSANTVGYILGIIIYTGILVQIIYQWAIDKNQSKTEQQIKQGKLRTDHHLRKLRIFIKATLLSFMYINPLYLLIALAFIEFGAIFIEYCLSKEYKFNPKMELLEHVFANGSLLSLILMPGTLLGLLVTSLLILFVLLIDIYRTIREYSAYKQLSNLQISSPGLKTYNQQDSQLHLRSTQQNIGEPTKPKYKRIYHLNRDQLKQGQKQSEYNFSSNMSQTKFKNDS